MAAPNAYHDFYTQPSTNQYQGAIPMNAWRTHEEGEPTIFWQAVLAQPSGFLNETFNPGAPINLPYQKMIQDSGKIPMYFFKRDGVNESDVLLEAIRTLLFQNFAAQRSLLWYISGTEKETRKFLNSVVTIMKERQSHIVPYTKIRAWDNRIPLPGSKRAHLTGPTSSSMTFGFHVREVAASMSINADLTEYYPHDYEHFIKEQTILLESAILAGKIFYFLEFLDNFAPRRIDYVLSNMVTTTVCKNAYATKNTAPIFKQIEELYLRSFAPTMFRSKGNIRDILNQINDVMKQVPERENKGFDGIFCTDFALEKLKTSGQLMVMDEYDFGSVNPIYELNSEDTKEGYIDMSKLRGTQALGNVNYFNNNFKCASTMIGDMPKYICALPKTFPHLGKEKNSPLRSEERLTRYMVVYQPFKKITSQIARGLMYDEYHISTSLSQHDNMVLKMKEQLPKSGLTYANLYDPEDYFKEVLESHDYFKDVNYMDYRKAVFEGKMSRNHQLYLYDTLHPFLQKRQSCGITVHAGCETDTHLDFLPGTSDEPSSYVPNNALDQFGALSVGTSYQNYNLGGYGMYGYGPEETGTTEEGENNSNDSDDDEETNGGLAPNLLSKCPYSPLMLEGNIPLLDRDDMLSKVILFNSEVTKFEDSFGKELLDLIMECCSKVPSKKQAFLAIKLRNVFNDEAISLSANNWTPLKRMYLSFLIQELATDYKSNAILTFPRLFFFAIMSIGKSSVNEIRDFFRSIHMKNYFNRNFDQIKEMIKYYSHISCLLDCAFKTIGKFITATDNDLTIFRSFPTFSETIPMADTNEVLRSELNTDPYSQMYRVFETFLITRTESVVMPTKINYIGDKIGPDNDDDDDYDDDEKIGEDQEDFEEENIPDEDRNLLGIDLSGRFQWNKIPIHFFNTNLVEQPAFKPKKYWVYFKYPVGENRRKTEILRHMRCPVVFYQARSPRIQKLPNHLLDATKYHPLLAHSPHITTPYHAHQNSIYNLHAFCKYEEINTMVNLPFGLLWCFNIMCHVMCKSNVHKYMLRKGIPMFRSILILQQEKFITSSIIPIIKDRCPRIEEGPMLVVDKSNESPIAVTHNQRTLYGFLDKHAAYAISNAVIEEIDELCDMRLENLENIFNHQTLKTHDKKLLTGAIAFFIHMSDVEMITQEKLPPVGGRRTVGLFNLNTETDFRSCDTTRIDKAVSIAPTMHPLGYQEHVLKQLEKFGYYYPLGIGTDKTHFIEVPFCNNTKERYETSRDRVNLKHMELKSQGGVDIIERFHSLFHAFTRTLIAMNVWQLVRNSEGKDEIIWIQNDPFSYSTSSGTEYDYDRKGLKFMTSSGEPFFRPVIE